MEKLRLPYQHQTKAKYEPNMFFFFDCTSDQFSSSHSLSLFLSFLRFLRSLILTSSFATTTTVQQTSTGNAPRELLAYFRWRDACAEGR